MANQTVKITSYIKEKNYFCAELSNGEKVYFDPFVYDAISLSNDEYASGEKAAGMIGKTFKCFSYSVQEDWDRGLDMITPDELGMTELI